MIIHFFLFIIIFPIQSTVCNLNKKNNLCINNSFQIFTCSDWQFSFWIIAGLNWVFRQKLQKKMNKKYLVKNPSTQTLSKLEASTILNCSSFFENKPSKQIPNNHQKEKIRMKTEGPQIAQQTKITHAGRSKQLRTLKRADSSSKLLKKGNYYVPINKENSKGFGYDNANRFTFNQFRDSDTKQIQRRLPTESGVANRKSQSKHLPRGSLQRVKMDRYKFCSPKLGRKLREANETLEMKSMQLCNKITYEKNHETNKAPEEVPVEEEDVQIGELIGAGTFGQVFSGHLRSSGRSIAIKRVQQDKKYKTRELQIIKMLKSPFIVKVLGTYITDEGKYERLNIIMQAYTQNFFELIRSNSLNALEVKVFIYQMVRGLNYLHSLGVCHRDLKPQNVIVKGKRLVICDFGSAKVLSPGQQNISYICSRCYRAPELIFQSTTYSTQIDMWSLGCILLELLNGRPLFIADSSLNHILQVIKVLGTPTKDQVKAMNPSYELSEYDLPKIKGRSFLKMFPEADQLLIGLIEKLVCYSPQKRLTALNALLHPYFDQLRDQRIFKKLLNTKDSWQLFHFQKGQISEGLRDKLVPKWWSKIAH